MEIRAGGDTPKLRPSLIHSFMVHCPPVNPVWCRFSGSDCENEPSPPVDGPTELDTQAFSGHGVISLITSEGRIGWIQKQQANSKCSFLFSVEWQLSSTGSRNRWVLQTHLEDISWPHSVQFSSSHTEANEHFPIYTLLFSDLSGYVKCSPAAVMGSVSAFSLQLLITLHTCPSISKASLLNKNMSKLSQTSIKQLRSK